MNRSAVSVLVVDVREVRMAMPQWLVAVFVNMGLAAIPIRPVLVLVMQVVRVCVAMHQWLMNVLVLMILGEVQPNTEGHANGCDPEGPPDHLTVKANGQGATDERSRCEIRARSRCSQVAQ